MILMNYITRLGLLAGFLLAVSSCTPPPTTPEEHALKVILQHPHNSYENFVTQANYPSSPRIYFNDALMRKANSSSPLYICLQQQRARLYVNGQVAGDWPVSTGTRSHPTPSGTFRIVEKKASHSSSLYGTVRNSSGKVIRGNADSRRTKIPAGGRFVGAAMPYWQRLTWDGIGLHVGRVVPGRRLSHGCIRMPRKAAQKFYYISGLNRSRVYIKHGVESQFPESARTAMKAQKILKNYRDYAKKQGVTKGKVKVSKTFEASQRALTTQLPSLSEVQHIPVEGISPLDQDPKLNQQPKQN